ncbi:uncharacterized protein LOC114519236 isoform X2 [Dendronephthya gigantea]|uniref:uncharacterized protein LOC114519236 isoform X2 n=1 Tax=Dendronephthya gigantea TaxID=151771 RepID=UPI00106B63C1|nr:uncharacterized protein LOC114519236 isoform X2 [Dendronephthya gigantea]
MSLLKDEGKKVFRRLRFMSHKMENKIEQRANQRNVAATVGNEVQHDIIMYWTQKLLGNPDIYITLQGTISQTEQVVHLQQNSATPTSSLQTATPLVYRVMIQPVPGLDNLVVSSGNGTVPYFDKILIVRNNEIVYEFHPLTARRLIVKALSLNEDTRNATLVNEYQAQSIRFMVNGMCVNPLDSSLPPTIGTKLVLRYNCGTLDTFFTTTPDKRLQHIASGLYVDGDIDTVGGTIPANGGSNVDSEVSGNLGGAEGGNVDSSIGGAGGSSVDSDVGGNLGGAEGGNVDTSIGGAGGSSVDSDVGGNLGGTEGGNVDSSVGGTGGGSVGNNEPLLSSAGGSKVQLPMNSSLENDDSPVHGGEHSNTDGHYVDATGDVINDKSATANLSSHSDGGAESHEYVQVAAIKKRPSTMDGKTIDSDFGSEPADMNADGTPMVDNMNTVSSHAVNNDVGRKIEVVRVKTTNAGLSHDFESEPADVSADGTPMVDNMNAESSNTVNNDVGRKIEVVRVKTTNAGLSHDFESEPADVSAHGTPMVDNMSTESSHAVNNDVGRKIEVVHVKTTNAGLSHDFESEPADMSADGTPMVDNMNTESSHAVNNDVGRKIEVVHVKTTNTGLNNDFESEPVDVKDDDTPIVNNMGEEITGEEIGRRHNPHPAFGSHGTKLSHPSSLHKDGTPQGLGIRHLRRFSHFTPKYNLHSKYKSRVVAQAAMKNNAKKNAITPSNQGLDLYLSSTSNLQFQYTSNPVNVQTDSSVTSEPIIGSSQNDERFKNRGLLHRSLKFRLTKLGRRIGRQSQKELPRAEMVREGKKRALTTNLKYYLQENETGLCMGYVDKQMILMPCESVPSSVKFCGKPVGGTTTQTLGQPENPEMVAVGTESTTPMPYTVTQEPYSTTLIPYSTTLIPYSTTLIPFTTTASTVVSTCGGSCSISCYPSCTQSCCSSGLSSLGSLASGSCGSGCPSSCYPSCTSSCCNSGDSQGISQNLCPGSCSSASQCPSSHCPQSCCSGQSQGGSYMSQSLTQGQICPSGCKRHCHPSCPFICC